MAVKYRIERDVDCDKDGCDNDLFVDSHGVKKFKFAFMLLPPLFKLCIDVERFAFLSRFVLPSIIVFRIFMLFVIIELC